jgi:hypothetical protein
LDGKLRIAGGRSRAFWFENNSNRPNKQLSNYGRLIESVPDRGPKIQEFRESSATFALRLAIPGSS